VEIVTRGEVRREYTPDERAEVLTEAAMAEAPEHAKRELPQMQRIFYAGAAATYDAILKATYGASGPQDVADALEGLLARMDAGGDEVCRFMDKADHA
jgi:hypothetical protein